MSSRKSSDFSKISSVLDHYKHASKDKFVSREFQQYGYNLAEELGDLKHKSLYIKLAKTAPRGLLESARTFVKDSENAKNKGALFMWKLKHLNEKK